MKLKNSSKYPHILRNVCCRKKGNLSHIRHSLYYCLKCGMDWYVDFNGEVKRLASKS